MNNKHCICIANIHLITHSLSFNHDEYFHLSIILWQQRAWQSTSNLVSRASNFIPLLTNSCIQRWTAATVATLSWAWVWHQTLSLFGVVDRICGQSCWQTVEPWAADCVKWNQHRRRTVQGRFTPPSKDHRWRPKWVWPTPTATWTFWLEKMVRHELLVIFFKVETLIF